MNPSYRFFYHSARLVLGAVFIYASLDKQCNPWAFSQAVYNYQVLPDALINLTALILPWLELILGFCLILERWMMGASSLVAVLMAIFMGLIVFNLARGLDINCGCFSTKPEEGPMDKLTLARDGLFLCLALGLAALTLYKKNVYHKDQIDIV